MKLSRIWELSLIKNLSQLRSLFTKKKSRYNKLQTRICNKLLKMNTTMKRKSMSTTMKRMTKEL